MNLESTGESIESFNGLSLNYRPAVTVAGYSRKPLISVSAVAVQTGEKEAHLERKQLSGKSG